MKRAVAGILTLAVVAGIISWKSNRSAPIGSAATPAGCVERMFETAMRGDVAGYLGCFADAERQRLATGFGGDASAGEALKRSVADLKGWALLDPPAAIPDSTCTLTVEWVYATRVDRQRLELRRESEGWRIARVESVQPGQPPVPYGTPVYGTTPEAVPTLKSDPGKS